MPDSKLIDNIQPYNDIFYKNCFYNSFIPVAYRFGADTNRIFSNDVIAYHIDDGDSIKNVELKYFPVLTQLELIQNIGIEVEHKKTSDDIISDIIESISNDKPVIIWIDAYYETIRKDVYNKSHWPHTLLLYGFNSYERIFHIIEHKHRENLSYEKKLIRYDDIINAYKGYQENFLSSYQNSTFFSFSHAPLLSGNDAGGGGCTIKNTLEFAKTMQHGKTLINNGLDYLKLFIEDYMCIVACEEELKSNVSNLLAKTNNIINLKHVENYRINRLFNDEPELASAINEVIVNWTKLRADIAKFLFSNIYNRDVFSRNIEVAQQILQTENAYNSILFSTISKYEE